MRDGWTEVELGKLFETTNVRLGPHSEEPEIYSVTKYDGFVPAKEYFGKRIASAKLDTYKVVEADDWAYSTIHIDEGSIARNRLGGRGVVSPMYTTMRLRGTVVLPYYAELVLCSPQMLAMYADVQQGSVNRRRSLPWRVFSGLVITLPPLAEQRRIVDVVGALDDTIAAFEGHAGPGLYAELLREIHRRYEAVPLGTVLDSAFAGGTPSRKRADYFGGEIPWLKSGEVENDRIETTSESITIEGLLRSSAKMVPAGSTVVAMYGQGDTKGRAGYVASPVATNQAVLSLQPNLDQVDSRYLLHAMRSRTESLRSRAVGAAQPNLSKGLVLSERIPLPPLAEQAELAGMMDSLLDVDTSARGGLQALRALRSNLLTALLSGEHEIPESYDELIEGVA